MLDRVHNGDDFGELAKHFSDGGTAAQGGELGNLSTRPIGARHRGPGFQDEPE